MNEVRIKKELHYLINLLLENKANICELIEFQNLSKSFSYEQCENFRKFFLISYIDSIRKDTDTILKNPQKLITTLKNIAYIEGKEEADFKDLNTLLKILLK